MASGKLRLITAMRSPSSRGDVAVEGIRGIALRGPHARHMDSAIKDVVWSFHDG
jgi:hypothetical protein